jgi:biotin-(acetyl-CoA carboxylase) ligase
MYVYIFLKKRFKKKNLLRNRAINLRLDTKIVWIAKAQDIQSKGGLILTRQK